MSMMDKMAHTHADTSIVQDRMRWAPPGDRRKYNNKTEAFEASSVRT
jgi:hypothetical protein